MVFSTTTAWRRSPRVMDTPAIVVPSFSTSAVAPRAKLAPSRSSSVSLRTSPVRAFVAWIGATGDRGRHDLQHFAQVACIVDPDRIRNELRARDPGRHRHRDVLVADAFREAGGLVLHRRYAGAFSLESSVIALDRGASHGERMVERPGCGAQDVAAVEVLGAVRLFLGIRRAPACRR